MLAMHVASQPEQHKALYILADERATLACTIKALSASARHADARA
jgi:hypothetical protein